MGLSLTNVANSNWPQSTINDFLVSTIELVNNQLIKVWFTRSASNANIKTNYIITGPTAVIIGLAQYEQETTSVGLVSSQRVVRLYLNTPITVGQWSLTFSNIVSNDSEAVALPTNTTVLFDIVEQQEQDLSEPDSIHILKFVPRNFRNKTVISGILESIEAGDEIIKQQSRTAFNQYFINSASGNYLTTRAGDSGIPRIEKLGISDQDFNKLSISAINNKLTNNSISSILASMYGQSSVSAYIETALPEPYQIFNNADLGILINNQTCYSYTVNISNFTNPVQVTALELVCDLNLFFQKYNTPAIAEKTPDNKIRIYNKTKSSNSTISVVYGTLQPSLQFEDSVFGNLTFEQTSTNVWGLSNPSTGVIRFTQNSGSLQFNLLFQNDYVTITGNEFPEDLRGSWNVSKVNYTFEPTETSWFEIESDYIVISPYTTITQIYKKDLWFFRPVTKRIYNDILWSSVIQMGGKSKISIPATSRAVQRSNGYAGYLKPPFYTYPTKSLTHPASVRASRLLQNYNNSRTVTVYNSTLVNAAITSDGNLSTTPQIETGDTILTEGSVNTGPADTRNTTNSIPAAIVHAGVFSQGYIGEVFDNTQFGWVLGGNKNIGSLVDFDPITGVNAITVSYDDEDLIVTSTNVVAETANLFPTCCIIKSDIHINDLFYTGGMTDWSTTIKTTIIYKHDGTSSSASDCSESMTKSCAIFMLGTELVLVNGGLNNDLSDSKDSSFVFDVNTATWSSTANNLITSRRDHKMIILDGGPNNDNSTKKWILVIGGKQDSLSYEGMTGPDVYPVGVPVNKCELLYVNPSSPLIENYIQTGSMSVGRYAFGVTKLPDNRVLVCGGIGYDPSYPIYDTSDAEFNYELRSCEIYDPQTGQWSPIPDMLQPHSYCVCSYLPETNKIFVYGGYASTVIEYLDLDTMTWYISDYFLNSPVAIGTPLETRWGPALLGGGYYNIETDVFQVNDNIKNGSNWNIIRPIDFPEYSRHDGLNGEWRVDSYDAENNTWSLSSNSLGDYTDTDVRWSDAAVDSNGVKFNLIKSVETNELDIKGPYSFDLEQPFTISGQKFVLNQEIKKGVRYDKILVVGGAFDLTDGYLLFNYGYSTQTGPVKFYTTTNDNTILIDAGFSFPFDLASGTIVNLLYQRAAYEPATPEGGFWLTASNAGRSAALYFIKYASAAGIEQEITTRYPGDRGLGNEGYPVQNNYKINEIVNCFGQDSVDAELTDARQSLDQ